MFSPPVSEIKLTRARQVDIPSLIGLCCFQIACSVQNPHKWHQLYANNRK